MDIRNVNALSLSLTSATPSASSAHSLSIQTNNTNNANGSGSGRNLKSSIALALRNIPGAIFKMSSCFAFRNLDIIKIESRPATVTMNFQHKILTNRGSGSANVTSTALGSPRPFTQYHWDLIFYIDYTPSDKAEVNDLLLQNLYEYCLWIVELGTYHRGIKNIENSPSEWTQMKDVLAIA